jgi:Rod binding domain-containing protein
MDASLQSMGDIALSQGGVMPKLTSLSSAPGAIDKTATDFEGMFMSQMLQPMFEGLGVDPVFGGGHGEEVMRNFLVQEYGKAIAKNAHFGITDAVKKQMIATQAMSGKNTTQPMAAQNVAAAYGGTNALTQ